MSVQAGVGLTGIESFGLSALVVGLTGVAAVLSNRVSQRLRVPAPALFLIGAAVASDVWPQLGRLSIGTVEQMVTVALVLILFDGGMHIGWRRFRSAAVATVWIGVAGTLVTAAAIAAAAHLLFSFGWHTALLLGTALAPTDPAVVFSVLGRREVEGRTGVLLEGESGANDPVGIALLVGLLGATGHGLGTAGHVAAEFVLQMAVGTAVGLAAGAALLAFMRRVPLPSEGLYALRVLAAALAIFGLATVAHGSGFLAVFLAGIVIGDARAPYKGEIERFHSALASLAEIVAFILLGLTVRLYTLPDGSAWLIGLALAALLAFVIRPALVGLLLWPVRLAAGERLFVLWTGLKGAVPVLLGAFIVGGNVPDAGRLYSIIFVVVAFSVIVQGSLVPTLAHRLRVPLRAVEPEPWSAGFRLQHEPEHVHRYAVAAGSAADGSTIADLPIGDRAWISLVMRAGRLTPITSDLRLRAGDQVLMLIDDADQPEIRTAFTAAGDEGPLPGAGRRAARTRPRFGRWPRPRPGR